jgi:hypothetical protein
VRCTRGRWEWLRREGAATFDGAAEGEIVGEFEAGTGRESVGDAGDVDVEGSEAFGEVEAGGIAFDIGAEGDDDLADGAGFEAGFELLDAEIVGFNAAEGGDFASENVVTAAE